MVLPVELDGSLAGPGANGLALHGSGSKSTANSIVAGLKITGFDGDGIQIGDDPDAVQGPGVSAFSPARSRITASACGSVRRTTGTEGTRRTSAHSFRTTTAWGS